MHCNHGTRPVGKIASRISCHSWAGKVSSPAPKIPQAALGSNYITASFALQCGFILSVHIYIIRYVLKTPPRFLKRFIATGWLSLNACMATRSHKLSGFHRGPSRAKSSHVPQMLHAQVAIAMSTFLGKCMTPQSMSCWHLSRPVAAGWHRWTQNGLRSNRDNHWISLLTPYSHQDQKTSLISKKHP